MMFNNLLTFYGKTIQIGNKKIITLSRNLSSFSEYSSEVNQRLDRWRKFQKKNKKITKNRKSNTKKDSVDKIISSNILETTNLTSKKNNDNFCIKDPISHISRLENYTGLSLKKPLDINNNETFSTNNNTNNINDSIIGYTDASYIKGHPAGIGIYFGPNHHLNTSIILDNVYNSCEAEIIAAQIALRSLAVSKYYRNQHIIIRTDFKGIIDAMRNGNNGRFCKEYHLLRSLAKYFPKGVTFEWIKGHNGDYGNEMADFLAKSATNARSRSIPTSKDSGYSSPVNSLNSVTINGEDEVKISNQNLNDKIKDLIENEEMYRKKIVKKQWYL
ncbi:Ribonuclease H domain and Ribonuclease H-like domain-containing protein [Strongyloides ratti]|uniref:ribonuclease H n=1 Tax=Strongyloides ratti TaxID=34506 RepID=A0A090LI43_STRRB|nr:Ribonuclease H domain and Ribonuclease H-like domain-containing protein [Strongyloides ratti]CEF69412.1 Ribonuclease H domain and Ribonuclease H-like domain-containing protein [Strongyloides ratti]